MHINSLPPTDRDEVASTAMTDPGLFAPHPEAGQVLKRIVEPGAGKDGKDRVITIYKCNQALRAKLRELRDAPGSEWSNNKFAAKVGVSYAVISQYLNDRGCIYDGDISKLERALDDFLRNEERRRVSGIDTSPCDAADQMLTAFEFVRKTNDVGAVVAESGEGKSRGIQLIQKECPNAMLFHVRAWCADKGSVMAAIWEVIPHAGYDKQTKRAVWMVTSLRGTDRPLIVDDAHKLTRPALHLLFDLYDETNIPIILIGTEELVVKLEDDAQRFSRVGIHWVVRPNEKKSVKLLEHMIRSIAKNVNGDFEELLADCEKVRSNHGHFRSVEKQLKLAAELISTKKGAALTWPQAFRKAHTLLLRQYQLT